MGSMDVLVAECTENQDAALMPNLKMVPVFYEKPELMTGLGPGKDVDLSSPGWSQTG